ncbi:MAG: hypothetical protein WC755_02195 [Candidatus Woesearchaeota archaeon]|jgi:hypothetical protein
MNDVIFIKNDKIDVCELKCQYIPNIFSSEIWPGDDPMKIENSPHVELLFSYKKYGLKYNELFKTRYVRMFQYWNKIGYSVKGTKRDKRYIKKKIVLLIDLFKSIGKVGLKKKIEVVISPFWLTRYKCDNKNLNGIEIWHGHHRAACLFVLGIKQTICNFYKDAHPGSLISKKWESRLKGVKC